MKKIYKGQYAKLLMKYLSNKVIASLTCYEYFPLSLHWGDRGAGQRRGLETDHVILGPLRGLRIDFTGRGHTNIHIYRHCDSMTDPAQRAESVKNSSLKKLD